MKILVTGALGHVGSRLIEEKASDSDIQWVLVDSLATQRYGSLLALPKTERYEFYQEDIREVYWKSLLKGVDAVIHLAALTSQQESLEQPDLYFEVNRDATLHLAKACLKQRCPIIFPSTTSVYGAQQQEVDEACQELKPQSPYANSKLQAERGLLELHQKRGLPLAIVRMGTIFGISQGMRFHTVVNKFCRQAKRKEPLTIWQTAWQQKRPYLDVLDAIRGFEFLIKRSLWSGEIYNWVTCHAPVSEIVERIESAHGPVERQFVDSPAMNDLSYETSRLKMEAEGFSFQGDLDTAIRQTLEKLGAHETPVAAS